MRIDVIGAVLRVVFDDEDGGVVPVRAVGDGIDHAAERQIVVGDRGLRRGLAGTRASGVVVGQIEQRELRKFFGGSLRFHKLVELAQEFVGAELVGIIGIRSRERADRSDRAARLWSGACASICGIAHGHGLGPPRGLPTFGGKGSPFLISATGHVAEPGDGVPSIGEFAFSLLHHTAAMNSP